MKRLKKLLLLISVMACAFCFSFGLVACGHEHTFDTAKWEKDATNHWHPATCEHTDEKADLAAHSYDATTGDCVCGAHEHKYNLTTWAVSPEGHYHAAICSDKANIAVKDMKDFAPHDAKGENNTCSVCGYPHEHEFSKEWVNTDPYFHWYKTTCGHELSGIESDGYAEHDWDKTHEAEGYWTCRVCEYRHDHTYGELKYNKNDLSKGHWRDDTCGHGTKKDVASEHTFDPENDYKCVCGAQHQHSFNTGAWVADGENGHYHPTTCDHDVKTNGFAQHNWDKTHEAEGYWICSDCDYRHDHTYDEKHWVTDATGHWYADTCNHGTKKGYATHSLNQPNNTCVCGYHEHTYGSGWVTTDSYYHWHEITCGHQLTSDDLSADPKSGYAFHDYTGEGNTCVCGLQHTHQFNMDKWVADGDNGHYHPATCIHTELKTEGWAAHDYDPSTYKCKVCQYQHTHKYAEEWTTDEEGHHWQEDTCEHGTKQNYGEHQFNPLTGDCVCGKHQHVVDEEYWESDDYNHWHVPNCEGYPDHSNERVGNAVHDFDEESGECRVCHHAKPVEDTQKKIKIYNLYNEYYKFYNDGRSLGDLYDWERYLAENGITRLDIDSKNTVIDQEGRPLTFEGHDDIIIRDYLEFSLTLTSLEASDVQGLWGQIVLTNVDKQTYVLDRQLFDEDGVATLRFLPFGGNSSTNVKYSASGVEYGELTDEEKANEKTVETYKYRFKSGQVECKVDDTHTTYSGSGSANPTLGIDEDNKTAIYHFSSSGGSTDRYYLARNLKVGAYYRVVFESTQTSVNQSVQPRISIGLVDVALGSNRFTTDEGYIAWDSYFNITNYMLEFQISFYILNYFSGDLTARLEEVPLSEINSAPDKPKFSLDNTGKTFVTSSATETVAYDIDGIEPGLYHINISLKDSHSRYTYSYSYIIGDRTGQLSNDDYIEIKEGDSTIVFKCLVDLSAVSKENGFNFVVRLSLTLGKVYDLDAGEPVMGSSNAFQNIYCSITVKEDGLYKFGFYSKEGARLNSVEGLGESKIGPSSTSKINYIWETTVQLTEGRKFLKIRTGSQVEYNFYLKRFAEDKVEDLTLQGDTLTWKGVDTLGAKYQVYMDGEPLGKPLDEPSYKLTEGLFGDSDTHNFWVIIVVGEDESLASDVIELPVSLNKPQQASLAASGVLTLALSDSDKKYVDSGLIGGYLITLQGMTEYHPDTDSTTSVEEPITIQIDDPMTTSVDLYEKIKEIGEMRTFSIKGVTVRVRATNFLFKDSSDSTTNNTLYFNKLEYPEVNELKLELDTSDKKVLLKLVDPIFKGSYDLAYKAKTGSLKTQRNAFTSANGYQYQFTADNNFPKGTEMEFYAVPRSHTWYEGTVSEKIPNSNTIEYTQDRTILAITIYYGRKTYTGTNWQGKPMAEANGPYDYYDYYSKTEAPTVEIRSKNNEEVYAKASFTMSPGQGKGPAYGSVIYCAVPDGEELYAYMVTSVTPSDNKWMISFGTSKPLISTQPTPAGYSPQGSKKVITGDKLCLYCFYAG